jgi:ferric-dicitrate binding protein FerR (iron transport regulator)
MNECQSMRVRYFAPGAERSVDAAWLLHLESCPECRLAHRALPHADRALADLARMPSSVPSFDQIAGAAASAARAQRRRRAVRRSVPFLYTSLGTAAVAAGIAAALLVSRSHRLAPKLLAPGAEIQATSEAKSAILDNGVRIRLDTGSLKLASASKGNHALVLPLGRVFLEVPKLATGSTLSVRTPDAEVRVHGTRFQVIRTAKETQVHVSEGVVEVRPEGIGRPAQTVRAGESVTVASAEVYRAGLRDSTLAALDHGEFGTAEKQIGQLLGSSPEAVQRAEAQALLAWSLAARGKRGQAIERYRQALAILPEGRQPLWAENACAELAILVQQESPQASQAVWGDCLRRFPDGVHASLARSRVHSGR